MTSTTPVTRVQATRDVEAHLARMRSRFLQAEEALTEIHREALEDFKFRIGGDYQWDSTVLAQRTSDGRPCYTINRIPEFVRQVTGVQKKNRPAIEVSPLGDDTDVETAEIVQGVTRHIERLSNADEAYDTAFESMITGGFGFFRLVTEYVGDSMDQEICFRREPNPFSHYPDPRAKELDYSDARYWFVLDEMSIEDFEEEYPDSTLVGLTDFGSIASVAPGWLTTGSIRVAEYFWIETKRELIKRGGKTRPKVSKVVHWCKTNGVEILDEAIIPGEFIPIVPVLGEEIVVEGRRYLIGIVRNARKPQELYNIWQSAMAETIALAPKAPYVVTPVQIEGFEEIWEKANSENLPYLPVNPDPKAPGWPQRQFGEPPIQAITSAIAHADNDLKTTTGLYDASLGSPGPEQSGKAILLRQKQGEGSTFGFIDSMRRAIKHAGRIILAWIPVIYDTERIVRIVNPDGTSKVVPINQPFQDAGLRKVYDLTVGSYDVAVSSGPSYDSMRDEAAQAMLQLVQAQPELMQVIGDLLVGNFDWPMAKQISERLKKMLPPQLQDAQDGQPQLPPQIAGQMQQMNQIIEQLTEKLRAEVDLREQKTLELASRERIAAMQVRAQVLTTMATIDSKEALSLLDADLSQLTAAQTRQAQLEDQALDQQQPKAA